MTKKVQTTETYTCDFCGKKCVPVREIRLFHSCDSNYSNEIILKIEVNVPYWNNNDGSEKHSCKDCLEKCMKNNKTFI